MPISTIGSNSLNQTSDLTINGQTVGKGGGNVATNTAHGVSALQANTSGANNVSIGYQASYSNTTASEVVAIGKGALYTNSTGDTNTAVGFNALTLATGAENTALGNRAMQSHTTGTNNVAVGRLALQANTTSSNNTAIGYQAMYSNTTGQSGTGYSTAVGNQALYSATGSRYDVAIGSQALYTFGGGFSQIAIGYQAMYSTNNTNNCHGNVAIGSYDSYTGVLAAMYSNTYGSQNVAVGFGASSSNTTGSNNTTVGYQAGAANTTQSNKVYVGYSCGSSQTGAGNVFLGASSFSGYNGDEQVAIKVGNSGREALYGNIGGGGSFRQYSNSSTWATTSDQRVKENIVEITNGLEKIVSLRPVEFDYITTKEHNAGFVAQEFKNVLPDQVKLVKARPEEAELVGEDEIYTIQQNLTPYLVKSIQELKTIVDAQAAEIAELKAKVA